jgi:hypothetical protein
MCDFPGSLGRHRCHGLLEAVPGMSQQCLLDNTVRRLALLGEDLDGSSRSADAGAKALWHG